MCFDRSILAFAVAWVDKLVLPNRLGNQFDVTILHIQAPFSKVWNLGIVFIAMFKVSLFEYIAHNCPIVSQDHRRGALGGWAVTTHQHQSVLVLVNNRFNQRYRQVLPLLIPKIVTQISRTGLLVKLNVELFLGLRRIGVCLWWGRRNFILLTFLAFLQRRVQTRSTWVFDVNTLILHFALKSVLFGKLLPLS